MEHVSDPSGAANRLSLVQSVAGLSTAFIVSRALHTAVLLGVPDHIKEKPQTSKELAERLRVNAPALERLLATLTAFGVFAESGEGCFSINAFSAPLCTESSDSALDLIRYMAAPWHSAVWNALPEAVRTGANAFHRTHGQPIFDYFASHADDAQTFERVISRATAELSATVLARYDFSPFKIIVDVGGGRGVLLGSILQSAPRSRGILVDLPSTVSRAEETLAQFSALNRCQLVPGNFFEQVPPGGDLYILKQVLHDWGDDRAARILQVCREAMGPSARLLVIETVINSGRLSGRDRLMDLSMMILSGGTERSRAQFERLAADARLRIARAFPVRADYAILELLPL